MTFKQVILISFLCGLIWEFFAPLLNADSTTDLLDILCYILGGVLYLLIQKVVLKCQLRNRKG